MTIALLDAYGRPYHPRAAAAPVSAVSLPKVDGITAPSAPRRVTLATTDIITVNMTACPNKPDTQSYTLYHCYQSGQTVADFIARAAEYGITAAKARAHLAWDLKRERIALNA